MLSMVLCCCCYCRCSHSPFRLPLSCSLVISLSSIAFLLAWFGFCWLSFWLLVCVNFSFIEHGNFFKLFFCSHDMCGIYTCIYRPSTHRNGVQNICVFRMRTVFFSLLSLFLYFYLIYSKLSHFCAILSSLFGCCFCTAEIKLRR